MRGSSIDGRAYLNARRGGSFTLLLMYVRFSGGLRATIPPHCPRSNRSFVRSSALPEGSLHEVKINRPIASNPVCVVVLPV